MNNLKSCVAGQEAEGFGVHDDEVLPCCGLISPWYFLIPRFLNGSVYSVTLNAESMHLVFYLLGAHSEEIALNLR